MRDKQTFKITGLVTAPPVYSQSKYHPIYERVDAGTNGKWLKVDFKTKADAIRAQATFCCATQRRKLKTHLRGTTVYVKNCK